MIGLGVLLGLLVVLEVLGLPVLVLLYLGERNRMRERLDVLQRRIATLEAGHPPTGAASMPAAAAPAAPREVVREPETHAPPPAPAAAPAPSMAQKPSARAPAARASLEERVMERWAVWVGGVALALGAVFLVKYSIEQGWFGPAARVVSGAALGLLLWVLGEWVRRRNAREAPTAQPDRVPATLAAAGSVGLFASVYAAFALYDLLGPLPAFALLALVAALTVAQSLLHGEIMAWLGIGGIYAVPGVVTTPHPSMAGLLAYTGIATAGSTALLRWRGWPWLGGLTLAGALFWAVAAMIAGSAEELLWPLGLYLLALPILFVVVTDAVGERLPGDPRAVTGWAASAAAALLMWALVEIERYDTVALSLAAALAALFVALAWRYSRVDCLSWIAALLESVLIAGWEFAPGALTPEARLHRLLEPTAGGTGSYLTAAGITGAVFGLGGFALLSRMPRPERWAVVSAATPLLLLMAVYWRLEHFAVSLPWAALALGLAVLALLAVEHLAPRINRPGPRLALAAYAVAMTAAVSLAITMSLRLGWLTVALALELPALGWLDRRIPVRAFRMIAGVVAAAVLVRLLLNPAILDYEFDARPILNELLYLYGVPFAAFVAAAYLLRREPADLPLMLLQGGAVALGLALVTLELRHFTEGAIDSGRYGLAEQGLQSSAWLAVAYALNRRSFGIAPTLRDIAWRLIAGAAALHVLIVSALLSNPLLQPIGVGSLPVLDSLLLAYGLPALFAALFAMTLGRGKPEVTVATVALGLGFFYLTLEVRHWFQGPVLSEGTPSTAEWYAYSLAWLLFGAALVGGGIARDRAQLRLAGLAIGALVAVKVFVFDTAALSGLYRAASFLGLGASLVGFAYLYQRLIGTARGAGKI